MDADTARKAASGFTLIVLSLLMVILLPPNARKAASGFGLIVSFALLPSSFRNSKEVLMALKKVGR
jgi:hypothetical protein